MFGKAKKMKDIAGENEGSSAGPDYDDSPGNGKYSGKRPNQNLGRPNKKTMGNYAAKKAKFSGGIID